MVFNGSNKKNYNKINIAIKYDKNKFRSKICDKD